MSKSIAEWFGVNLWKDEGVVGNGLAYKKSGKWVVISLLMTDDEYTMEEIITADGNWTRAFEKIENGLKPDWCPCSCGAKAVMGKDWTIHDQNCDHITKPSPFTPKNNDGRETCFMCWKMTHKAGGGSYDLCKNKDCSWYNK